MARLMIGELDYGTQAFFVPLRDPETFKRLPGVTTGDIGPKLGYQSKDNGFAAFDHVRIPRTDMLMGITSVDRDGSFSVSGDPRMLYVIMMSIRTQLVAKGTSHMG